MPPASTGGNSENAGRDFRRQLRDATDALTQWDPYRDFAVMPVEIIIARREALAALRRLQTELKRCRL